MLFEARSLTKRFGGLTAVSDVTFGIGEGEIVGISINSIKALAVTMSVTENVTLKAFDRPPVGRWGVVSWRAARSVARTLAARFDVRTAGNGREALAVIDRGLSEMLHRELVSTDEVSDLLLDVRTLLNGTTTN